VSCALPFFEHLGTRLREDLLHFYTNENGLRLRLHLRPPFSSSLGTVLLALTDPGIFDIRQHALLQCLPLHNAAVNCIAVNNVDGYFVTGSADGDIKVISHHVT